jgi:hypothetical protein
MSPNYQHYKRFQDCSRSDESIAIFANFIGDVFRFVPASLEAYPPAEFLVGRVIYLPRVITVHKAEKNFVKKQMVDPFCRAQRAGHIFGLIIGYWLLDIGYWISSLLAYWSRRPCQIVSNTVALASSVTK